ncbi:MAG: alpha/beta fold hydrolase BchO [Roseobacter sp.]
MRWPPPAQWPHAARSQQVLCKPHRWHVQTLGQGADVLVLHGAGSSTHSFRALMPLLAETYRVIALDLPGQGFTQLGARHRCGLEETAVDIAALCQAQGWQPKAIIGHSAGGALALRLSQLLSLRGQHLKVVGINPALDNFEGLAGVLFPALAKMLSALPFTAQVFASVSGKPERVKALIRTTGSDIDAEGLELYGALMRDRDHADATLLMMAQWSIEAFLPKIDSVTAPTLFITGENDGSVPPAVSDRAAARMPNARVTHLSDLGHLAHEEAPEQIAGLISNFLAD